MRSSPTPFFPRFAASSQVLSPSSHAEVRPSFAYLFPALGSSGDRERAGAGMDAADFKARLLWNFTQFLGRLAARQPLCLILENLQWADASSLELLHFVARQITSQPIAFLVSYNDAERDANPMLRTTEQSLLKLGAASQLRIGPLSQRDTASLVEKKFGVDPGTVARFSTLLYGSTRGNAFFMEETLKWLVESKVLRQEDERWTGLEVESLQLPPNVRDAVQSRIDRLSPTAHEIATVGAVVGTHLTLEQISALSSLSDTDIADALDELTAQRVFVESPVDASPGYDFAHPILQQVAYSSLGAARAAILHANVAEALESFYGKRAADHAGELAFHFTRSRTFVPKAVTYLSEAGRTALNTYANREAATYLTSALRELDDAGETAANRDEIIVNLARARQRLGEYDVALALWARALESVKSREDFQNIAMIEHRMGLASFWSGRLQDALAHYTDGLAAAEQVQDSRQSRACDSRREAAFRKWEGSTPQKLKSKWPSALLNKPATTRCSHAPIVRSFYCMPGPVPLTFRESTVRRRSSSPKRRAKRCWSGLLTGGWACSLVLLQTDHRFSITSPMPAS